MGARDSKASGKTTGYISTFDELADIMSDDGFRLVRGAIDNMLADLECPGEVTIDLVEMARMNNMSAQRCMDAFNEVGAYMVKSWGRDVWMRLITPLWVRMENDQPVELVVYAFPTSGEEDTLFTRRNRT